MEMELASIDLSKESVKLPERRLRYRHMEIQPGGIVPLHSILRHWSAVGSDAEVRLLYSARSWDQVIYREELSALGAQTVAVEFTLTRSWPADWHGRRGRIDRTMLEQGAFAPEDDPLIYVCGPTSMVESVATTLVETGHRPERIRTERFGPTGG